MKREGEFDIAMLNRLLNTYPKWCLNATYEAQITSAMDRFREHCQKANAFLYNILVQVGFESRDGI